MLEQQLSGNPYERRVRGDVSLSEGKAKCKTPNPMCINITLQRNTAT